MNLVPESARHLEMTRARQMRVDTRDLAEAARGRQVGDQNVQLAAGRRRAWGMEEERARGEREANWLATVTGRDIVRRGRFWGN